MTSWSFELTLDALYFDFHGEWDSHRVLVCRPVRQRADEARALPQLASGAGWGRQASDQRAVQALQSSSAGLISSAFVSLFSSSLLLFPC